MRISGSGCCASGVYDRYYIGQTQVREPIVLNPDLLVENDWKTTSNYYLAKIAFKGEAPAPIGPPDHLEAISFTSAANGDWLVDLGTFESVGLGSETTTYGISGDTFSAEGPYIAVYANKTDEYVYAFTYKQIFTYEIRSNAPFPGASLHETSGSSFLTLIAVHAGKRLKLYEKPITTAFGVLGVLNVDAGFSYTFFNPKPTHISKDGVVNTSDLISSISGLYCWVGFDKMYISNMKVNKDPDGDRPLFVYIEIDLDTGNVVKEIINWVPFGGYYFPEFLDDRIIQDKTKIPGYKFVAGDLTVERPHSGEIVIGELTTEDTNIPHLINTLSLKTFYYGIEPSNGGLDSQGWTVNSWAQDTDHNCFVHMTSHGTNVDTRIDIFNFNLQRIDVDKTITSLLDISWNMTDHPGDYKSQYIVQTILNGYILVVNISGFYIVQPCSENGTIWYTKSLGNSQGVYAGGPLIRSNDYWFQVQNLNVVVDIPDTHVQVDSKYLYDHYVYLDVDQFSDTPDGLIPNSYYNLKVDGLFEPCALLYDPEAVTFRWIGHYDSDNKWIVNPAYKDKLIYEPRFLVPTCSLNFIRLSGWPTNFYFDTEGH